MPKGRKVWEMSFVRQDNGLKARHKNHSAVSPTMPDQSKHLIYFGPDSIKLWPRRGETESSETTSLQHSWWEGDRELESSDPVPSPWGLGLRACVCVRVSFCVWVYEWMWWVYECVCGVLERGLKYCNHSERQRLEFHFFPSPPLSSMLALTVNILLSPRECTRNTSKAQILSGAVNSSLWRTVRELQTNLTCSVFPHRHLCFDSKWMAIFLTVDQMGSCSKQTSVSVTFCAH